jgi:hypothetical protein
MEILTWNEHKFDSPHFVDSTFHCENLGSHLFGFQLIHQIPPSSCVLLDFMVESCTSTNVH